MTISQPFPPPHPTCSFPQDVASPAQSRPAHRNPPALPRPPRRTAASATSQIHPGVKVRPGTRDKARHVLVTWDRWEAEACPPHPSVYPSRWPLFLFFVCFLGGWNIDPRKDVSKPELLKQYCVLFPCAVLHKDSTETLMTVGWLWLDISNQIYEKKKRIKNELSRAERHKWIFLKIIFAYTQDNQVEPTQRQIKTFM